MLLGSGEMDRDFCFLRDPRRGQGLSEARDGLGLSRVPARYKERRASRTHSKGDPHSRLQAPGAAGSPAPIRPAPPPPRARTAALT